MAAVVSVDQHGVDGHWGIEDIFSSGDRVVVRWTGTGAHLGEVSGIPPTGRKVWDTLGFLPPLGVVPVSSSGTAGRRSWPARPRVRRASFISASNTWRRPSTRSSRTRHPL